MEKKKLSKEELIEKWNEKNKNFTISDGYVTLPEKVRYISITDTINILHRARALLKRVEYKTSDRKGKYI